MSEHKCKKCKKPNVEVDFLWHDRDQFDYGVWLFVCLYCGHYWYLEEKTIETRKNFENWKPVSIPDL